MLQRDYIMRLLQQFFEALEKLVEEEQSGGVTLDFETVYSQAAGADYWRIVNSYQGEFSYNTLKGPSCSPCGFPCYPDPAPTSRIVSSDRPQA